MIITQVPFILLSSIIQTLSVLSLWESRFLCFQTRSLFGYKICLHDSHSSKSLSKRKDRFVNELGLWTCWISSWTSSLRTFSWLSLISNCFCGETWKFLVCWLLILMGSISCPTLYSTSLLRSFKGFKTILQESSFLII